MHHMADIVVGQTTNRNAFIYMVDTSIGLHTHEFKRLLANEYGLHDIPVIPISTVALANHGPTGVGLGVYYGEIPRIFEYLK
jgi:DegV family protein